MWEAIGGAVTGLAFGAWGIIQKRKAKKAEAARAAAVKREAEAAERADRTESDLARILAETERLRQQELKRTP